MKERVLITGASGFIGYHLIGAALEAGLEVYAALRPSSQRAHLQSFDIRYCTLDFTNPGALSEELATKQYHYIIHAAGVTKARNAAEYYRVNAEYTRNLALAASGCASLKKFVFISSLAALGPTSYRSAGPIDEQSIARPLTAYGKSKLQAEHYLKEIKDLPYVTLRPTAVYGPREKDIFILLKTIKRGFDPYISRQLQRLSFVYVKDLAKVAVQALRAAQNRVSYNLSDGKSYDRYALADITKQILGRKTFRFHIPLGAVKLLAGILEVVHAKSNTVPALNREKLSELTAENWNCSIAQIQKDLGYDPEYDLEKGLLQTLQWYKKYKWL